MQTIELSPSLKICRLINGMWQLSGGHGQINLKNASKEMLKYQQAGFTTWDMADIYGPAEEIFGEFKKSFDGSIQGLTKFVPNPGPMTRSIVKYHIEKSLKRMNVKSIDLLQFHWWDYNNSSYLDALSHLNSLVTEGMIQNLGLTNFDTKRMEIIKENQIQVVSNQVQYSILDQRPSIKMESFCKKNNVKLLTYGTLLGGFFSEKYLGKEEPTRSQLDTLSLQKYKNMIDIWGGWELFQELLTVMDAIAKKHQTYIANVATKFVLDKPYVGGVIIGARLGISNHAAENLKTFELILDHEDLREIKQVTSRSNDLFEIIGDCGDEYR